MSESCSAVPALDFIREQDLAPGHAIEHKGPISLSAIEVSQ